MVAVATRYLDNADEAEDITQDVLLKLWAMHEMLRESDVERIAFTILKHLCIDELRRREYRKGKQIVGIDSVDVVMESDNTQEIEERERQLMNAVGKLPSKQRLLLQMRYMNGKDIHTIAQLTGGTEESINKALCRARNKVYKLMSAVVVAIICVGLFAFIYRGAGETSVEAYAYEKTGKPEQEKNAHDSIAAKEPADKNMAVLNKEDSKLPTNLPARSIMAKGNRKKADRDDAVLTKKEDIQEENMNTEPSFVGDESESLGRNMMQAILETSSPEKVYAVQSQLPDEDISKRDRLRKKTVAIITLNE